MTSVSKEPMVVHNTFVIERSFAQPVERVFAAFADPAKKRRWFADGHSSDVEQFEMSFEPGGAERTVYRFREGSPFPGVLLSNEGVYQDIVDGKRVVMAAVMTLGDRRISSSLVTFEFLPTDQGTDLVCTHQGAFFEGSDGPEMRKGGWNSLLDGLARELAR